MNTQNEKIAMPRDFWMVVAGQIISLFGNALLRFALPLYLLRETGSAAIFGAVSAVSFIPMIFSALLGGVMADCVNKRNIMVVLDSVTALITVATALCVGKVSPAFLVAVALLLFYAIAGAYQPAVSASIPALVSGPGILRGNAVINMVSTLASLLGPVLGGVAYAVWGLVPVLWVCAGCFAASAILEIFIQIPHTPQQVRGRFWNAAFADLGKSWRYVSTQNRALLPVLGLLLLVNMVLSAVLMVGIPLAVVENLGQSDASLGLAQSAMGLGGLFGSVLAGALAGRLRLQNGYLSLAGCALAVAVLGVAVLPGLPAALGFGCVVAASFVSMAAASVLSIQMLGAVQQQVPQALMGKVMAGITAAANCAMPLGQLAYGLLFEKASASLVFFGAALLGLLLALLAKPALTRFATATA